VKKGGGILKGLNPKKNKEIGEGVLKRGDFRPEKKKNRKRKVLLQCREVTRGGVSVVGENTLWKKNLRIPEKKYSKQEGAAMTSRREGPIFPYHRKEETQEREIYRFVKKKDDDWK